MAENQHPRKRPEPARLERALAGAVAGCVAAGPMLALVRLIHNPHRPPPPHRVAMGVTRMVGLRDHLSPGAQRAIMLGGHFGFGAGVGAALGLLPPVSPGTAATRGAVAGLAIWASSYAGWIPALGILPPAHRRASRENAAMIAGHVLWGGLTGALVAAVCDASVAKRISLPRPSACTDR